MPIIKVVNALKEHLKRPRSGNLVVQIKCEKIVLPTLVIGGRVCKTFSLICYIDICSLKCYTKWNVTFDFVLKLGMYVCIYECLFIFQFVWASQKNPECICMQDNLIWNMYLCTYLHVSQFFHQHLGKTVINFMTILSKFQIICLCKLKNSSESNWT
jgi:hypothetical protein